MLKLRYWFRLLTAFFTRFKGLLLIGGLIGIGIFLVLQMLIPIITKNRAIRIGMTGRYQADNLPATLQNLVSMGLTKLDENGLPEGALAESWETADEGKTWTFRLRDGFYWHDGEKVTSYNIHYEFSDVTLESPDEKTLVFKLQEPFVPFPSVVSKPTFKKGLLGVGEWKVSKATVKGNYIQELQIDHTSGTKQLYKFYPTTERTKLAFKLGQVDNLIDLLDPAPFDTWKTTALSGNVNGNQVITLFFNFGDETSVFNKNNKELRQAAAYAINKENWSQNRAYSPIALHSWARNPQVKQYTYDPDRAEELLKEVDDEIKKQFPVRLVSTPILLPVAEKISDDWNAIGIQTVVQVSSIIPTDFQAFLTILDLPPDPDQYALWHSTQPTNISKYQSPRIDKLLEDGRVSVSLDERKRIYLDFQRYLLEDLPALFLYNPTYYTVTRK